jgi:hypothetical protein
MARKPKLNPTPTSAHFSTLRHAASLYYRNEFNPEPWAKPVPAAKPKRKRVRRTPAKG